MSGTGMLWRWRKIKATTTITPLFLTSRTSLQPPFLFTQISQISTHLNYLNLGCNRRKESLIGIQEIYKWGNSKDDDNITNVRKIRAEANCPRCSKHMDVLFSVTILTSILLILLPLPLPPMITGSILVTVITIFRLSISVLIVNQLIILGLIRSHLYKVVLLRLVELATGHGRNGNKVGKDRTGEDGEDYANVTHSINNRLRASFWETSRSYGGDPPENWPPGIPPPPPSGGNGLARSTLCTWG